MPLNRKPPINNIRLPKILGINQRGILTNKARQIVQFETASGEVLAISLDRRHDVSNFTSFPKVFRYFSHAEGKWLEHVPLFKVYVENRPIQYHDIYSSSDPEKEKAISKLIKSEGASYIIHTENTLPKGSHAANLIFLFTFRTREHFNHNIAWEFKRLLALSNDKLHLETAIGQIASHLNVPENFVRSCAFHLIWTGDLQIEMDKLLCGDSSIMPMTYVWSEK